MKINAILFLLLLLIQPVQAGWHQANIEWTKPYEMTFSFGSECFTWSWYMEKETTYGWAAKFFAPITIKMVDPGPIFSSTLKQGWSGLYPHQGPIILAHNIPGKEAKFSFAQCAFAGDAKAYGVFFAQDWSQDKPWVYKKDMGRVDYLAFFNHIQLKETIHTGWHVAKTDDGPYIRVVWDTLAGIPVTHILGPVLGGSVGVEAFISSLVRGLINNVLPNEYPLEGDTTFTNELDTFTKVYGLNKRIQYQGMIYPGLEIIDGGYTRPKIIEFKPSHEYARTIRKVVLRNSRNKIVAQATKINDLGLNKVTDPFGNQTAFDKVEPKPAWSATKPDQTPKSIALRSLDQEGAILWKKGYDYPVSIAWPTYTLGRAVGGAP